MEDWSKLPFDDFIDLRDDDLSISDLQKLDKQAAKTTKELEKLQRKAKSILPKDPRLPSTGSGPLAGLGFGTRNKDQEKQDKKFEREIEKIEKRINRDFVKNFGRGKEGLAKQLLGDDVAQTIFSIGKNPLGFVQNALVGAAGVGFALQVADQVIKTIQRVDRFFKEFVDIIDTRVDQLRSKEQQARIAAGLDQLIITTESGNVEARDAYNTYNEYNNNKTKLQEDFAIRNTSGYN